MKLGVNSNLNRARKIWDKKFFRSIQRIIMDPDGDGTFCTSEKGSIEKNCLYIDERKAEKDQVIFDDEDILSSYNDWLKIRNEVIKNMEDQKKDIITMIFY